MPEKIEKYTLKQIADIVGVATSTVSRVLNNRDSNVKITDSTVRKIHEAIRRYHYVPNISARRLARQQSFSLGLEVPAWNMGNHAFADHTLVETLRGIENEIIKTEYNLLLLFKNDNYMNSRKNLRLLQEKAIDGLLIWGASYLDVYDRELGDYPVIFLNSRPKGLPTFNFIGHDNFRSLFDMTEHAIAQGGRKFLYFSGTNTNSINEDRRNGFMAALQKHELSLPRDHFIQAEFRHDLAFRTMNDILDAGQLQFDTVICANDAMAEGVYDAAAKHNLRLPDAFRLAGGDRVNEEYDYNYNTVQITAFAIDCFTQGITATRQLIDLIEGKITGTHSTLLPTQFLQRQTL